MKITDEQLRMSYEVAKQVYQGEIGFSSGAELLQDSYRMNIHTARDLIRNFALMVQGAIFYRTMSASAADLYLTNISEEFDLSMIRRAITAMQQHIAYYEGLRGVRLLKSREVVSRHIARLENKLEGLEEQQIKFQKNVVDSLNDSTEIRRQRLMAASKTPSKVSVVTIVFKRNPDVVAEVLLRADGSCESCRGAAPFLRKSDGSPYLEVHHRKRLSEGGEDTVENAIALCPNCHRRSHFGLDA